MDEIKPERDADAIAERLRARISAEMKQANHRLLMQKPEALATLLEEALRSGKPAREAISKSTDPQEDNGPGGRALVSKDEQECLVEGWLLDVKKRGGTSRDQYADGNGVSPDAFGRWVTTYKKEHRKQLRI